MINDLKAAYARSAETLLEDAAGAIALAIILIVALHLPSLT